MTEYIEKQWREITSRNPVAGNEFKTGIKDFKFSVGQGYGLIPSQSYFRVELDLKIADGYNADDTINFREVRVGDDLAFADSCVGNMFNNIYFNVGGQTASSLTSNLGVCEVLKNRLTKSAAFNQTIGATQGFIPHLEDRKEQLASTDTRLSKLNGKNRRMFIWQPAIGIFDVSQPLGAGEYDIQLNPAQNFETAVVETGEREIGLRAGTDYTVAVHNIRFYACLVRVNLPASGVETLHLMEMSVLTGNNVGTGIVDVNEEVSVPSSTRAISYFVQDSQVGNDTRIPTSKFHLVDTNDTLSIQNYQIEYASMTKPTVRYASAYSPAAVAGLASNTLQQRYITSALESGQYFNPAGFEKFDEYLARGPFLHDSFVKSADNLATRLHLTATWQNLQRPSRNVIVAHYSRTIQITRSNGLVVDIKALNV